MGSIEGSGRDGPKRKAEMNSEKFGMAGTAKNSRPYTQAECATPRLRTARKLAIVAVAACFSAEPALSCVMIGGAVVNSGAACMTQNGTTTTVTTSTNKTDISFPTLSVPVSNTFHFQQPSSSASVLARVLSEPTTIYGTLSSNGIVWLINPNGIMVGPGGRVDTAGFVASTLNVTNADFLANRMRFGTDGLGTSAGNVINQGTITTPQGGSVYLIGKNVSNENTGVAGSGIITTPGGETILAAGSTVELIDSATPGVKVEITGAEGNATNLGTITATAGRIGIAGVLVRNRGMLNASSVIEEGGRVFLKASQDAYVDGAGRIVTTGKKGGSIDVLGNRVAVMDQASLDASGEEGGGKIRVGGDYQGKNPDIQNSQITYFGKDASLKVNATRVGAGGTAIIWSDDTTRAYGSVEAKGGAEGGNGGFVEISGKKYLDFRSDVNLSAVSGTNGTLLLDPMRVEINNGTTDAPTDGSGYFYTVAQPSTLSWASIQTALASGNLIVYAQDGGNGYIDVTASPTGSSFTVSRTYGNWTFSNAYNSNNKLSLLADGQILINSSFGNAGSGAIDIMAGWNGSLVTPDVTSYASGKDINFNGYRIVTNGNLTLKAGDKINLSNYSNGQGGIEMNTGTLTMTADKIVLDANTYTGGSSTSAVTITSNGDQTFNIGRTGGAGLLKMLGNQYSTSYGGHAEIRRYAGTSGGQTFNFYEGADLEIRAGSGGGVVSGYTGDCALSGANCSGEYAGIENKGSGGQTLTFYNTGSTISMYGGNLGNDNSARIKNNSGTQTIQGSTIANGPTLWMSGGSAGGNAIVYGSGFKEFRNSAEIGSDAAQIISVASAMIYGGTAVYGGAGIGADGAQTITIGTALGSGTLYMEAQNSSGVAAHSQNEFLDRGTVYIGSGGEYGGTASLTLNVYGSMTMTGANGSVNGNYGGSVAVIGSRKVSATDNIYVYNGMTLAGAKNTVRIGSDGNGGTFVIKTGMWGGSGTMDLGNAGIGTGTTGSVGLYSLNGALSQTAGSTGGSVDTNSLTVESSNGIDLRGYNRAASVSLKGGAAQPIEYVSYQSATITSPQTDQATTVNITSVAGSPYGGTLTIGTLYGATVNVTAYGGLLDNNASGEVNVRGGTINLYSFGGGLSGGLAISSDVSATGNVVAQTFASTYGGIRIGSTTAPAGTFTLNDSASSFGKSVSLYNYAAGTFNTATNNVILNPGTSGSVYIGAAGNLTIGQNLSYSTTGNVKAEAGGILRVASGNYLTNSGGSVTLAANTLDLTSGGYIDGYGGVTGTFTGNATLSGSGAYITTKNGALDIDVTGDLTLSGNAYFFAGSSTPDAGYTPDVKVSVGGNLKVNTGAMIKAYDDIGLTLKGAASTLYLNELTGQTASKVWSDIGMPIGTTKIDFTARESGGIVIDGVQTASTVAGGSGLFAGSASTPATSTATGLTVVYVVPPATQTAAQTTTALTTATNSVKADSTPTSANAAPLPPATNTGSGGALALNQTGTVGGGEGTFGGGTEPGLTGGTGTASSTESSNTASGQGSGDKPAASTAKKDDDKKDDKKDEKKAEGSEKKDEKKAAQKKVAQCT